MKLSNAIIPKPWGEEYILFENKNLSIWILKIRKGEGTSLHCHPNKKTGLILLSNSARISLMERKFIIDGPCKIMIRNECFHQTQALDKDITVLEVETPKDKEDLVRIKDAYGREKTGYEGEKLWVPRREKDIVLRNKLEESVVYEGFKLQIKKFDNNTISSLNNSDMILILNGHAFNNTTYNFCSCGEVLSGTTVKFLSLNYNINPSIKIIVLSKI